VIFQTTLLRIAATAGAWGEVTETATGLAGSLPEAGSVRAVTTVRRVATELPASAPATAVEAVSALLDRVEDITSS